MVYLRSIISRFKKYALVGLDIVTSKLSPKLSTELRLCIYSIALAEDIANIGARCYQIYPPVRLVDFQVGTASSVASRSSVSCSLIPTLEYNFKVTQVS